MKYALYNNKENNGKYYSVLYVSWKDPKVPLINL